jgi:DNA-binding PadR family transcriptional regulator
VRASILALLRERPMHGYEMIQRIGELTEGGWRPSPGSVYPTLQLLEEEGLIASQEEGGKRLFRLTESGRSEAEAGPEEPWRQSGPDQPDLNALRDAKQTVGGLMGAVWQVMGSGSEEQRGKALGILDEARRKIYLLLAEAGGSGAAASSGDEPSDAASPDDEPEDA